MSTFMLCCELSKAAPCSGGRGLRPSEMRTQDGAWLWCDSWPGDRSAPCAGGPGPQGPALVRAWSLPAGVADGTEDEATHHVPRGSCEQH